MELKTEQQLIAEAYIAEAVGKLDKNATPKDIDKALDNPKLGASAASHKNASAENLHKAINGGKDWDRGHILDTARAALKNKNSTAEHVSAAVKHKIDWVRAAALDHPALTKEHLETYLKKATVKGHVSPMSLSHARKAARKHCWDIKTKTVHVVE